MATTRTQQSQPTKQYTLTSQIGVHADSNSTPRARQECHSAPCSTHSAGGGGEVFDAVRWCVAL